MTLLCALLYGLLLKRSTKARDFCPYFVASKFQKTLAVCCICFIQPIFVQHVASPLRDVRWHVWVSFERQRPARFRWRVVYKAAVVLRRVVSIHVLLLRWFRGMVATFSCQTSRILLLGAPSRSANFNFFFFNLLTDTVFLILVLCATV